MGKTCHLPGTRNMLVVDRGSGELDTPPTTFDFGIGRPAIHTTNEHVDKYAQYHALPHDASMRNVIEYLDTHNSYSKGMVVPLGKVSLQLFSPALFAGIVDGYIESKQYTNATFRHWVKQARPFYRAIKGAFQDLVAQDHEQQLADICEVTHTSTGTEIGDESHFVVDPGSLRKLGGVKVALEGRYLEDEDGVLRVALDLSDRATSDRFEEGTHFVNTVLELAEIDVRYKMEDMDRTIPLFEKKQYPGTRKNTLQTPQVPVAIELLPYSLHH